MDTRFRILSIDGGGMRGLVPALLLVELEQRIESITDEKRPLSDYFHLFAGTSTGGLISLGLTAPEPMNAARLVSLYRERGRDIFPTRFRALRMLLGMFRPKFSNSGLWRVVREEIGEEPLGKALRDVVITSYDMTKHAPRLFRRWTAVKEGDPTMAQVAMATASAPTYLPPFEFGGSALVDGGVFAANPAVAAISEALKRAADPGSLELDDLFVVSLGTGFYPADYEPKRLRLWGALAWIWPRGSEPALMRAMLDGQTATANDEAGTLLNRGRERRYYRIEAELGVDYEMDDAREQTLEDLKEVAGKLVRAHGEDLQAIAEELARAGPIPPL